MSYKQRDLFASSPNKEEYQLARSSDPPTSFKAAAEILSKLNELQRVVYEAYEDVYPYGMTNLDLENKFNNHKSTYRTRTSELVGMGLLIDTGRIKFQEGKNRVVWALKPKGEG